MWFVSPLQNGEITQRPAWRRFPGRVVGLAAATVIAATISASGALAWSAVASTSSSGSEPEQRTLQLVTPNAPISADFNDAGHGGPANVLAIHFAVKTTRGAAAGDMWVSCTYFATERSAARSGTSPVGRSPC